MWSREELKTRAKAILKISYWKAFLVSLVIGFVGGNSGGGSFNFNWQTGRQNQINSNDEMFPYLLLAILGVLVIVLIVLAFRIFLGYVLEVGGRRYFIQSAQNNIDLIL